jgi:hypothetical protein
MSAVLTSLYFFGINTTVAIDCDGTHDRQHRPGLAHEPASASRGAQNSTRFPSPSTPTEHHELRPFDFLVYRDARTGRFDYGFGRQSEEYAVAMDPYDNPYTLGAGTRPVVLAGRERELELVNRLLRRLADGRHDRSIVIAGMRTPSRATAWRRSLPLSTRSLSSRFRCPSSLLAFHFLQEYGSEAWNLAKQRFVTLDDARDAIILAHEESDGGFFRARYEKGSPSGRRYMQAMASLGKAPYPSRDVSPTTRLKTSAEPNRSPHGRARIWATAWVPRVHRPALCQLRKAPSPPLTRTTPKAQPR